MAAAAASPRTARRVLLITVPPSGTRGMGCRSAPTRRTQRQRRHPPRDASTRSDQKSTACFARVGGEEATRRERDPRGLVPIGVPGAERLIELVRRLVLGGAGVCQPPRLGPQRDEVLARARDDADVAELPV